ncbi:MAG: SCO family protein [Bacteroidota bacterium]
MIQTSVQRPGLPYRIVFNKAIRYLLLIFLVIGLAGCGPDRMDDYSDLSVELVNQNGETVRFPDDFRNKPIMIGFIYTHCPDICSFITANLYKTWQELEETEEAHFLLITFDPERDTPEVLASYAEAFDMNQPPFQFLTGSPETIDSLMERFDVRQQVSYTTETEEGEELYFLNHTDKVLLIDEESRLVTDYGGSMTPVHIFTTDLENLL